MFSLKCFFFLNLQFLLNIFINWLKKKKRFSWRQTCQLFINFIEYVFTNLFYTSTMLINATRVDIAVFVCMNV